jgi:hypothetical protein
MADGNGLSPQQLRQLRAYLPPGFKLVRFESDRDIVRNGMHSAPANDYRYTYRNAASGKEFTLEVADSGWGDPGPDYSGFRRPYTVRSAALGTVVMRPNSASDPHDNGVYYRSEITPLTKIGNGKASIVVSAKNMSRDEMQKVFGSLQPVKR